MRRRLRRQQTKMRRRLRLKANRASRKIPKRERVRAKLSAATPNWQ
jgi:hypothetical protein